MLGLGLGLGLGLVGAVGNLFGRGKANKKMQQLQEEAERNKYVANPLAQQRLSLANSLLNARMPGATQAERNIQSSTANAQGQVTRNASSGAQALALGAGLQGEQNQAYSDLAGMEANDYQRRYANQENAVQGMIQEGDKVNMGMQNYLQQKAQLQGAKAENNANSWQSISNLGFSAANFGLNGGFDGSLWGKRKPQNAWQPVGPGE
jgi:hypothetical protein